MWLNNGLPMKTRTPIHYPQFLSMAPFVYISHVSKQQQLKRTMSGLLGGKTTAHHCEDNQWSVIRNCKSLNVRITVCITKSSILCNMDELESNLVFSAEPSVIAALKQGQKRTEKSESAFSIDDSDTHVGADLKSVSHPSIPVTATDRQIKAQHKQPPNQLLLDAAAQMVDGCAIAKGDTGQPLAGGLMTPKHEQLFIKAMQYKLMSVVEHNGDVMSGHFVTFRRAPSVNDRAPEQWLLSSDAQVRKVTRHDALNAEAYLLFYERK